MSKIGPTGRGGRFGGRRSQAAVLAGGAVAGGAVGYAAYQASHKGQISRFHSNRKYSIKLKMLSIIT